MLTPKTDEYIHKLDNTGYDVVWRDDYILKAKVFRIKNRRNNFTYEFTVNHDLFSDDKPDEKLEKLFDEFILDHLKHAKKIIDCKYQIDRLKEKSKTPYYDSLSKERQQIVMELMSDLDIFDKERIAFEFYRTGFNVDMTVDLLMKGYLKELSKEAKKDDSV